jgi:hypothetical protein
MVHLQDGFAYSPLNARVQHPGPTDARRLADGVSRSCSTQIAAQFGTELKVPNLYCIKKLSRFMVHLQDGFAYSSLNARVQHLGPTDARRLADGVSRSCSAQRS